MARLREFDEETVLAAAMAYFWLHGYRTASVRDLARSMGITLASLYNAFGDKRALYRRALDSYIEASFGARSGGAQALPPRRAIDAFFQDVIESAVNDVQRKGCMVINATLELAPHDPEFQDIVAGVLVRIEAFFPALRQRRAVRMAASPTGNRRPISPNICWPSCWACRCWHGPGRSARCWRGWSGRPSPCSTIAPRAAGHDRPGAGRQM